MVHRILILGNRGMLGHMVEHVLASDARLAVRGASRAEFDVLRGKTSGVEEGSTTGEHPMLRSAEFDHLLKGVDFVINCIGTTARHIDERDSASVARAIRVNAEFPHVLVDAAAGHGIRVIHMSTDGVFSGASSEPYDESAVPDATDVYGRTKLLGESHAVNTLNIRCSIVGPSPLKHEGLWEWVAAQPDGATVDGYTNHIWHGVTTLQFAELCRRIIGGDQFDALRAHSPILHFAPNAPCTKAELVAAIADALGKRMTVRPVVHAPSVRRMLAMRLDLVEVFGTDHSIIEALHSCSAVTV